MPNSISQDNVSLTSFYRPDIPFFQWSADDIASWLHDMGLHLYVSEAQRWNCRGQMLLDAPFSELEKELCIKHPLHKKKLILALEARGRAQDPMSPMPIMPGTLVSLAAHVTEMS